MKASHRRPLVLLLCAAGTAVVAAARHDVAPGASNAATEPASRRTTAAPAAQAQVRGRSMSDPTRLAAARRWPAEIEQLLSSTPRIANGDDTPPTIETDQRCSRVEDGLAHCVMLECQTAGEQTACFEMVVTARRLNEPPAGLGGEEGDGDDERPGAYEDHPLDGPLNAPDLLDTAHPGRKLDNDRRRPRGTSATTRF